MSILSICKMKQFTKEILKYVQLTGRVIMTEEEKLDAGLYYDFWDAGVNGRKLNAIKFCRELRKMSIPGTQSHLIHY